jgi:hypothetical protein
MSKATPRPWALVPGEYHDRAGTSNAIGGCVCVYSPDDAELIVRAVNMHDELLAAIERFVKAAESYNWRALDVTTDAGRALVLADELLAKLKHAPERAEGG